MLSPLSRGEAKIPDARRFAILPKIQTVRCSRAPRLAPPPLFGAWLVAISPLFRSCLARSRGNSCLRGGQVIRIAVEEAGCVKRGRRYRAVALNLAFHRVRRTLFPRSCNASESSKPFDSTRASFRVSTWTRLIGIVRSCSARSCSSCRPCSSRHRAGRVGLAVWRTCPWADRSLKAAVGNRARHTRSPDSNRSRRRTRARRHSRWTSFREDGR